MSGQTGSQRKRGRDALVYDELIPGGETAKQRKRCARKLVDTVSGSPSATNALVRDMAGFDNVTTQRLAQAYRDIGDSAGEIARGRRLMLLYPLRDLSLQAVNNLGFKVGGHLWASLQAFQPWSLDQPQDQRSHKAGRRENDDAVHVRAAWWEQAVPTPAGQQVVHGLQRDVAEAVKKRSQTLLSWRAVLRLRPAEIAFARRPTDLCPICEEHKKRTVSVRRSEGQDDENNSSDDEHAKVLAGVDKCALSEAAVLESLQLHVNLRSQRRCAFNADISHNEAGLVTIALDWAAAAEVRSKRGTSTEFHSPVRSVMFGAVAYWVGGGGVQRHAYWHAYGHPNLRLPKTGAASAVAAYGTICSILGHIGPTARKVVLWHDTAQHFRNRLYCHELPRALIEGGHVDEVRIRFHAEHHGKTALDASFQKGKMWVREHIDRSKLAYDGADFSAAVSKAYRCGRKEAQRGSKEAQCQLYFPLELAFSGQLEASELNINGMTKVLDVTVLQDGTYKLHFASGAARTLRKEEAIRCKVSAALPTAWPSSLAHKSEAKTHAVTVQKKFG